MGHDKTLRAICLAAIAVHNMIEHYFMDTPPAAKRLQTAIRAFTKECGMRQPDELE